MTKWILRICFALTCLSLCDGLALAQEGIFFRHDSILDSLQSITDSTIPSNGDLNPYGVAFVPANFPLGGSITAGNVLVSNFNANSGLEGTGTTIVSISPTGQQTLFATWAGFPADFRSKGKPCEYARGCKTSR